MNPAPSPSIDCVLLLLLLLWLLLLLLLLLHRNHLKAFHGTTSMYGSLQATISFNSAGRGDFGCLLSKCCLYVLGSGIVDIRTVHLCIMLRSLMLFVMCLLSSTSPVVLHSSVGIGFFVDHVPCFCCCCCCCLYLNISDYM